MSKKIGLLVGSLRKDSFSRKIALEIQKMAPEAFDFEMVEIGKLEIYNQDYDDHHEVPTSYTTFRDTMRALDGIMFVTPEYNRSIPSVLKNAIDVGSRPYGKSVWDGKPAAVISNSPGGLGAFGANHHLRQCLVFLNVPVMQQPEAYLSNVGKAFDQDGNINDEEVRDFLKKVVDAYIEWFKKTA